MPRRRRSPDVTTLFLFRNQCVTYPRHRPSIRTLIFWIEALGYEVTILPPDIEWADIPQEYWGVTVLIDNRGHLLFIAPLPCRRCQLTRSGVFLGCYEDYKDG